MKLSEVDAVLIRYADTLSSTAISFKIEGRLTPQQVMSRITTLLDTPDWLTAAQQDQIITMKLRVLITQLEEMPLTARLAEVMIAALEKLGNRLDRRSEATERDLSTLYAFQGTVMLEAISVAMGHMRERVTDGDAMKQAQWDDALESAIRFAQMELAKHEIES